MFKELNILNLLFITFIVFISYVLVSIEIKYIYIYFIFDIILSNRIFLVLNNNEYIKNLLLIFIFNILECIYFIYNMVIPFYSCILLILYLLRFICMIFHILLKLCFQQFTYKMERIQYNPNIIIDCSICLEQIDHLSSITICNHIYHNRCIYKWLILNDSCPVCREKIKESIIN